MTYPTDPTALATPDVDVFALAARQLELDREAVKSLPFLAERKKQRLAPAPFAFLRGSAPLFYEILAKRPDLARGPLGDGWIVGDMHLENVGAYRNDADEVVFGLNDFDDASIGPLRYDVLRFSTSVLLAGRAFEATGAQAIALVQHALATYLKARGGGAAPPAPAPVAQLIEQVRGRTRKALLDAPLSARDAAFCVDAVVAVAADDDAALTWLAEKGEPGLLGAAGKEDQMPCARLHVAWAKALVARPPEAYAALTVPLGYALKRCTVDMDGVLADAIAHLPATHPVVVQAIDPFDTYGPGLRATCAALPLIAGGRDSAVVKERARDALNHACKAQG